jgi:hypothetical protein
VNLAPTGNVNVTAGGNFQILSGAGFRIYNSGNTDYMDLTHDGTDFTTTFVNTTDWNITGPTGNVVLRNDLAINFRNSSAIDDGTGIYRATASALRIEYTGNAHVINALAGHDVIWRNADVDKMVLEHGVGQLELRDGYTFRIYDSTDADHITMSHDGTDFNIAAVGTTDINLNSFTAGGFIRTNNLGITLGTGQDIFLQDGFIRIRDAAATDYAEFHHDGTDFTVDFVNTTRTEWGQGSQIFKLGGVATGNANIFQIGKGFDVTSSIDWIRGGTETIDARISVNSGEHMLFELDPANAVAQAVEFRFNIDATQKVMIDDEGLSVENGNVLYLEEIAAAVTDKTGYGQLWVKNTTPCQLWFTDDAGTDTQIV